MLERFRQLHLREGGSRPQQLLIELVCAGVLVQAWLCSSVASNGF